MVNWYDESPLWLAATITSAAPYVDHVVAADGAYGLFPDGEPQSRQDQAAAVTETSQAAGLGLTLHRPQHKWFGNEVEKRTRLFQLAELDAEPNTDWYLVMDADMVIDRCPTDIRRLLSETDHDVAQVSSWERDDPYAHESRLRHETKFPIPTDFQSSHRALFRAIPGLRVDTAHYRYRTPTGDLLWGYPTEPQADALNLCDLVRIEHRSQYRIAHRRVTQQDYYTRRDAIGAEAPAQVLA